MVGNGTGILREAWLRRRTDRGHALTRKGYGFSLSQADRKEVNGYSGAIL